MLSNKTIIKKGLSSSEAAANLKKYGENSIFKKTNMGPLRIFLSKFKNPLFILMIGIVAVSFFLGAASSAIIVLLMILLSVTLDFINTYKSQKTVEKLASKVAIKVTVVRDGKKTEIEFQEVVPGDIIFLSAGNVIPADSFVLLSDDFFINQSSLTGESIPAEKIAGDDNQEADISAENDNIVFMGTSVVSGFAYVKALRTGANTEFGKITASLSRVEPKTDFEINMMNFGIFVMKVIFSMVCFVFVFYLIKNAAHLNRLLIVEAFTFALAITIGVTPDMLPAVITICLSKGSQLMAKKEVIVKHLASIENFGSMDILCTDKTGTLTKDKISLVKYLNYKGEESKKVLELGFLSSYYHTGVSNPLDSAIIEFKDIDKTGYEKIDEIPYDFTRKRSSMVVEKEDKRIMICKGAPEEIISISKFIEIGGDINEINALKKTIEQKFKDLSAEGFRVLAVSYKEIESDSTNAYDKKNETAMIFSGFLAFLDPPKEDVRQTLDDIERLGIEIKILTGDNELLAQKICRDIDLKITGVLTGKEISQLNDLELEKAVLSANIFARVNPDQKERIILTLKKAGKAVGYLGDGINDVPALRAADVGISVNNAVEIAKDTADIILLKKDLESLKDGIIEGRKTFHNTMKYVLMGLSSNFGNMFSMMGAVTFLPFLPMLPGQVLFNNFVYDASQFSLPTDAVDEDELLKPAHWDLKFIKKYMIVFGLTSSIFDFLTFFMLFYVYNLTEHQFQTGWLIESIATQTFVIYIIRTKKIPFLQSSPSKSLLIITLLAVAFVWIVPFTFIGRMLMLERLPLIIMAIIFSYVLAYLLLVEFVKRIFYRLHERSLKNNLICH
jgi:Mg2+-importing ATPase